MQVHRQLPTPEAIKAPARSSGAAANYGWITPHVARLQMGETPSPEQGLELSRRYVDVDVGRVLCPAAKNPETQPRLESFTLMHLYRDRVLPHLIHFAMRNRELAAYRARIVPHAEGRVLEIGIGSGLNLPFYADRADEVLGLEPSCRLVEMARGAAASSRISVTLLEATAEQIPLDESTIDTVITAWTLCSIPDVSRALGEIRRVLRPGGQLLFVEHGLSPEERVRKWQNRLTPVWKLLSGGCHLNRPITRLIEDAGFRIDTLNTAYMRGPKLATFMYEGIARQR